MSEISRSLSDGICKPALPLSKLQMLGMQRLERIPWPWSRLCRIPLARRTSRQCKFLWEFLDEALQPYAICMCHFLTVLVWVEMRNLLLLCRSKVGLLDRTSGKELMNDTVLELCEAPERECSQKVHRVGQIWANSGSTPTFSKNEKLVTFLILTEESKTFELKVEGASAKPVPSLLRGFSAPVKLEHLASFTRYKIIPTDLKLNDVQSLSADSHLIAWDQVGGIGNKSETIRLTSCLRKGMTTAMRISHCWLALTLIPSIDGSQCSVWDQRRLNRSTHYILAYASSV